MKKFLLPVCCVALLLLGGCASVETALEKRLMEQSGVLEDPDHVVYLAKKEAGELNEAGYYEAKEEKPAAKDPVRVTFGTAEGLETAYYLDEDLKTKLQTPETHLRPGDCIYAAPVKVAPSAGSQYRADGYKIMIYDGAKVRQTISVSADEKMIYAIPLDGSVTDLAILPVGTYVNRKINFRLWETDGIATSLTGRGEWSITVNDETVTTAGTSAIVDPVNDYKVKLDYDESEFFCVATEPKALTVNQSEGTVSFEKVVGGAGGVLYSVQLREYLTLDLRLEAGGTVTVNNGKPISCEKGKSVSLKQIKYDDKIVIRSSSKDCAITKGDYKYIKAVNFTSRNGGYEYTLEISSKVHEDTSHIRQHLGLEEWVRVRLANAGRYGKFEYELNGEKLGAFDFMAKVGDVLEITYVLDKDGAYQFAKYDGVFERLNMYERTVEYMISGKEGATILHPDEMGFSKFEIVRKG